MDLPLGFLRSIGAQASKLGVRCFPFDGRSSSARLLPARPKETLTKARKGRKNAQV